VLLRSDSLLPIAEIVFLLTMCSPQRMPLRSTYQQMMFQTRFTEKNCSLISLCIAVIMRSRNRGAASMNSPRL
jgi:hypothetical protein